MLYESQVIAHVCEYLRQSGCTVSKFLGETERGIDIEALKGNRRILIEAKGGTSSKAATARYAKPFNTGQITSHISRALFKAAEMIQAEPDALVAIALPDDPGHRLKVTGISVALGMLGVEVLWASEDGTVRREGLWRDF